MKREAKEENDDPSLSAGKKDQPTLGGQTTVPGTMFDGQPEVSLC